MDLARGTYSLVYVLVSACLVRHKIIHVRIICFELRALERPEARGQRAAARGPPDHGPDPADPYARVSETRSQPRPVLGGLSVAVLVTGARLACRSSPRPHMASLHNLQTEVR